LVLALGLCQCKNTTPSNVSDADVVVSVKDQKLGYYRDGNLVQSYKVSTSKFGVGDKPGSWQTPLGKHEVIAKIGRGLPTGAVLKSRQWNGEVLPPNAPGRDPIVSRIIWLSGLDADNHNALRRFIYIHGTTEENRLGKPASYGCVRMSMSDVVDLFNEVNIGARVVITEEKLPAKEPMLASNSNPSTSAGSTSPVIELPSGPEPQHSLGQRRAKSSSTASTPDTGPKTEAGLSLKTPKEKGKAVDVASASNDQTDPATPEKKSPGKFSGLFKHILPGSKTSQQNGSDDVVTSAPKDQPTPKGSQKKGKAEVVASAAKEQTTSKGSQKKGRAEVVASAAKEQTDPTPPEKTTPAKFSGLFKHILPVSKTSQQKDLAEVVSSTTKDQPIPKVSPKKSKGDVVTSAAKEQSSPRKAGKSEPKKKVISLKNAKKEGGPESSPPSKKHKADTAA